MLETVMPEMTWEENGDFTPLFGTSSVPPQEVVTLDEEPVAVDLPQEGPGEELLQMAEDEFSRRLRAAHDTGLAEGRRQAEESVAAIAKALEGAVSAVMTLREKILRECEDDLLKLSILVAKQIIQQEVTQDRRILAQFIGEALRSVDKQEEIILCLHPEDCRVVSANSHSFLGGLKELERLTIKPSDETPPGGCIVESTTGVIDARIEAQLDVVFRRLVEERCSLALVDSHRAPEPAGMVVEVEAQ
jgi:flagellar assembly protein FliH